MPITEPKHHAHAQNLQDLPGSRQELGSLIAAIWDLYHRLFHERLRQRLRLHDAHNRLIEFPSITATLDAHKAPFASVPPLLIDCERSAEEMASGEAVRGTDTSTGTPPEHSHLGTRFLANNYLGTLCDSLSRKLRVNAERHLAKAICLSRQQRHEEARTYGLLADSAIDEARRYLTPEDFLSMKRDFESRLLRLEKPSQSS